MFKYDLPGLRQSMFPIVWALYSHGTWWVNQRICVMTTKSPLLFAARLVREGRRITCLRAFCLPWVTCVEEQTTLHPRNERVLWMKQKSSPFAHYQPMCQHAGISWQSLSEIIKFHTGLSSTWCEEHFAYSYERISPFRGMNLNLTLRTVDFDL